MVRQTNKLLNPKIQVEGCYFLSGLKLAQDKCKKFGLPFDYDLEDPAVVNTIYDTLVRKNIINARCLMQSPTQFFAFFGLDFRQRVASDGVAFATTYMPFDNESEILCFKTKFPLKAYTHFVLGDGQGIVAWDPMGSDATPLGYVCTKGKLDSKRIFTYVDLKKKATKPDLP